MINAAELPGLLGVPLSPDQLAAATAPAEPGIIVAGAGSGKTTVMAARVAWLVGSDQARPDEILGLTFTNKATGELLQRLRRALGSLPDVVGADDTRVSTYHAFAGQLIREFGVLLGIDSSAELMSSVRQRQLALRVVASADIDPRFAPRTPTAIADQVLALDSALADSDVRLAAVKEFDEGLLAALATRDQQQLGQTMGERAAARGQLCRLVGEFRDAKEQLGALDFADQVRFGARLAREVPQVGAVLRARHRFVLLDEYQDTSIAQRVMLQHLFGHGHPVTAVGDPCQAIYGWRGASPANMDHFGRHFPTARGDAAATFTLPTNRRSGADILAVANRIAEPLRGEHPAVEPLRADPRKGSGRVECALLPTAVAEEQWIAERLAAIQPNWADVAILTRTNDGIASMAATLRSAGIPVQVLGRQALLAMPEVRWLVWALRAIAEEACNDAVAGLLLGPPARLGIRDLAILARRAQDLAPGAGPVPEDEGLADQLLAALQLGADPVEGASLFAALLDPGPQSRYAYGQQARDRMDRLAGLLRRWQRVAHVGVPDLLAQILQESGLAVELALGRGGGAPGSPQSDSSVRAFAELARTFDDIDGRRSVADFLGWLRLADDVPDGPKVPQQAGGSAVTLLTVHAAKGLEFPIVVLPGLVAGSFPSSRGRGRWTTSATALPNSLISDSPPQLRAFPPDPAYPRAKEGNEFDQACREADLLEETRLAYVAATRAEDLLIATAHRWGRSQRRALAPSQFLLAIRDSSVHGHGEVLRWEPEPDEGTENPVLGADTAGVPLGQAQLVAAQPSGPPTEDSVPVDEADPDPRVERWSAEFELLRAELGRDCAADGVPVPARLSVSGVVSMVADPAGFALAQLRPVPRPPSRVAAVGTEFHEWVQSLSGQLGLWEEEVREGSPPGTAGVSAELRDGFLASPFGSWDPVAVEYPVEITIDGHAVTGRIDAVFERPDGIWVVDWKTGSAADPLQLAIYRAAWAQAAGIDQDEVLGCFVFVGRRRYELYRGLPPLAEIAQALRGGPVGIPSPESHRW